MAEKVLVVERLAPETIDSGRELVRRLAQDGVEIRTALWLFSAENGRWRPVLASPEVRTGGSLLLYRKAGKQLMRMGEPDHLGGAQRLLRQLAHGPRPTRHADEGRHP